MRRHWRILSLVLFIIILFGYIEESLKRKIRRRVKLVRSSLLRPQDAPWKRVLSSGRNSSVISFTGLDLHALHLLLGHFKVHYMKYTLSRRNLGGLKLISRSLRSGRPRLLCPEGCLTLVLAWFRSAVSLNILSILFGTTPTSSLYYLRLGMLLLLKVLHQLHEARISWPSSQEQSAYIAMISSRYPALHGCFGCIDGCRVPVHPPANP